MKKRSIKWTTLNIPYDRDFGSIICFRFGNSIESLIELPKNATDAETKWFFNESKNIY